MHGDDWLKRWLVGLLLFTCGLISFFLYMGVSEYNHRIKDNEAVARFQELAQTDNVVVVRKSNSSYVTGDPMDVTYELLVDGKPVSGRCTSGTFSDMVCRLYQGSGD